MIFGRKGFSPALLLAYGLTQRGGHHSHLQRLLVLRPAELPVGSGFADNPHHMAIRPFGALTWSDH